MITEEQYEKLMAGLKVVADRALPSASPVAAQSRESSRGLDDERFAHLSNGLTLIGEQLENHQNLLGTFLKLLNLIGSRLEGIEAIMREDEFIEQVKRDKEEIVRKIEARYAEMTPEEHEARRKATWDALAARGAGEAIAGLERVADQWELDRADALKWREHESRTKGSEE